MGPDVAGLGGAGAAPIRRRGRSQVVGYSVALPPGPGERPVWYGGGKLARDLTLTAIRRRWDGQDPADALSAWTRTSSPDRSRSSAEWVWPRAQQALSAYTEQVRAIPLAEHAEWQAVTRETSELLAALASQAPDAERARISRAARNLSRAAETPRGPRRGQPSRGNSAARMACQMLTEISRHLAGDAPSWGQLAQQVVSLVGTIRDARDAAAARQASAAQGDLLTLERRLTSGTQAPHPARLAGMAAPVSPTSSRPPGSGRPPGTRGTGAPPHRPGPDPGRGRGRGR